MLDTNTVTQAVEDSSQVAVARRAAVELANHLGFSESNAGRVALLAAELGANLWKHGGGGEIIVRALEQDGRDAGLELLAVDRGCGIADIRKSLRDGFSTAGTYGVGLGAVSRLADQFDIYSVPDKGTAIVTRLWNGQAPRHPTEFECGAVCRHHPKEDCCGDAWACEMVSDGCVSMVADGLGHGPQAREAALLAIRILREHSLRRASEIVERAHEALRATRGAALAVAQIDSRRQCLRYCGLGNISALIMEGETRRQLVSHYGTAGVEGAKIAEFTYPWSPSSLLIMHSDGLKQHWALSSYPGLSQRDTSLIAAVLYRDFFRGNDDVTVMALRARDKSRAFEVGR